MGAKSENPQRRAGRIASHRGHQYALECEGDFSFMALADLWFDAISLNTASWSPQIE
jgi:hypothetical protein